MLGYSSSVTGCVGESLGVEFDASYFAVPDFLLEVTEGRLPHPQTMKGSLRFSSLQKSITRFPLTITSPPHKWRLQPASPPAILVKLIRSWINTCNCVGLLTDPGTAKSPIEQCVF